MAAIGQKTDQINLWAEADFRGLFRAKLKSRGEVFNYETTFNVIGSKTKTGLVSACIVHINDEAFILLVIRDITKEKVAEEALVEMDRMKGEFISTAAHELNTPLTTMMGYAEFLRDPEEFGGFSDEQKHDFMTEIYDNGEALSRIVEDLLDISRIESGKPIPLVLEHADITEILARKVKSYRTHNVDHLFYLSLPDTPAQPEFIFDRHRISQALENLLSNAVKYSPAGTTIHVSGHELEKGWEITVEDQGIGMNADQLEKVFDKFFRADASNTAIKGLGLGMSIVKQIIETHGGWINVESNEGQGTKVSFLLPYEVEAVSDLV